MVTLNTAVNQATKCSIQKEISHIVRMQIGACRLKIVPFERKENMCTRG